MRSGLTGFECEDGYPTDAALDALRNFDFDYRAAALLLVHDLVEMKDCGISCMSVAVSNGRDRFDRAAIKRIEFHTGGWSGAEDLIDALLGHFWIRHFHTRWERGGHFYFEVPEKLLTPSISQSSNDAACE